MPENVSVVGESLIPLVDSNRIPTAGTLTLSDSVPGNVMPLIYETEFKIIQKFHKETLCQTIQCALL